MEMRKAQGDRVLLVTPGNYGQDFLKTYPWVRADHSVKCSNYVGKTLEFAAELGFDAILFVAHLGKFVKVSGGIMNTHSHEADCRAELLTAPGRILHWQKNCWRPERRKKRCRF